MQTLHKWNRLQLHGLHISLPSTAYDYFPKLKEILEKKQDTFYLKLLLYTYIYVILNNF